MNKIAYLLLLLVTSQATGQTCRLENHFLSRQVAVVDGRLKTTELRNKLCGKALIPTHCEEFRLRLSHDVDSEQPDTLLTAADFDVMSLKGNSSKIVVELCNQQQGLRVSVHYTLSANKAYGHKYLIITTGRKRTLELVEMESIAFADAFQPYCAKEMMCTRGRFSPALGQPLYTKDTATFWGVEFPASWNRVENTTLRCGYQRGLELLPNVSYTTYRAVYGVADSPSFIKEAFLSYIDDIRATPATLKIQYNSWFDFGGGITQKRFLTSLETLHQELVVKRGCRPLDVYVIDDGWQNSRPPRSSLADWGKGLYPVNETTFDAGLQSVRKAIEAKGSKMGLWASPACLFGAAPNVDVLEKQGFEVLVGDISKKSGKPRKAMSIAGPKFMALLEKRLLELVETGSVYFKFDGFFGDLSGRLFETKPNRGTPVVSHLLPRDILADDPRLDAPEFDETKRYYLTAATERIIQIFDQMHQKNPEVRILCHNGATISPWWLMHVDVLSLVNSRDGAPGGRTEQMCYRDALYYQLTQTDGSQVPLCSFFNHEPAKDGARFGDATPKSFRDYLFMAFSRGTLNVEFYFQVSALKQEDFDVIAEGLKWLYEVSPTFKRARMHGGNPLGAALFPEAMLTTNGINLDQDGHVYGYTGWTETQGYVSIHNPTVSKKSYSFTLDRPFGLVSNSGPFQLSFPLANPGKKLKSVYAFGETVSVDLEPREVVILQFSKANR